MAVQNEAAVRVEEENCDLTRLRPAWEDQETRGGVRQSKADSFGDGVGCVFYFACKMRKECTE